MPTKSVMIGAVRAYLDELHEVVLALSRRIARRSLKSLPLLFFTLGTPASFSISSIHAESYPTQYVATLWQTEQGLPQNSIAAMVQDRDGFLWLATSAGLARFDGVRFRVFGTEDFPSLRSSRFQSLYASRTGDLWIGTRNGGLIRLHEGAVSTYTESDGLPSTDIRNIREDAEGKLWINTMNGIACCAGGKLQAIATYRGKAVSEFFLQARDRSMWFRSGNELVRFGADGSTASLAGGFMVQEARDGSVWVAFQDMARLVRYHQGEFSDVRLPVGAVREWAGGDPRQGVAMAASSSQAVLAMTKDTDGELLLFTPAGLVRAMDGKLSAPESLPLPASIVDVPKVLSLLVDREGNRWVGTVGRGLLRFRRAPLTAYGKSEGLSDSPFRAVFEDRDGRIWLGGDAGVHWFDGRRFHIVPGLTEIGTIAQTKDGDLWFGGSGAVYRRRSGVLTRYGIESRAVFQILQDREGTVWIVAPTYEQKWRLYRFREGTFEQTDADVVHIAEDRKGGLWLASIFPPALRYLLGGKTVRYDERQGMPPNGVHSFWHEPSGDLWFTTTSGLYRLRDGRFGAITAKNGLTVEVTSILDDGKGNLWLPSERGILRVSLKDLNDVVDGKISSISPVSYGVDEGMRISECNGGVPGACKARDGRLWFPTMRGVVAIDPRIVTPPPVVVLEDARAKQVRLGDGGSTLAAAGNDAFDFQFTALSLTAPERQRFKYRLEPFDEDWVDAGTRRTAHYTNMAPGKYSFRVIAANSFGVWNEQGASVSFVLQPHFYQTNWFRGLCAAAFVALLWVGYRFRIRQLGRAFERLRNVIETIPAMAWTALPDGTNDFVNRRWADYTGLSAAETAGSGWEAAVHPEDSEAYREKLRASVARGEPFEFEARLRCAANGEYRWFLGRAAPLRDKHGNIQRWYGILTDIEDRKRAEETLRESETRFRTFVDNVGDAIMVQDEQGTIVDVNRQGCEGLGYTREEVLGTTPSTSFCLNAGGEATELESVAQRAAAGETVLDRHWHRRKDGTVFPVEVHSNVFWHSGQRFLLKTVRDISESLRAEEAVRNSEKRLREAIDTIPAQVWSALPDGSVDFLNQRCREFSGASLEQSLGRGWETFIDPAQVGQFVENVRAGIAAGQPIEAEARMRRADGQYRWLLFRTVPLLDDTGKVVKWYGTSTDIDDRKRAEEALRRSEAYLAETERLAHSGTFAADPTTAPLYWSDELHRIFGFDPQDGLPTPDEALQRIHPEDVGKFKEAWDRAINQKVDAEVEYRIVWPDGTVKHVYGLGHPVLNANGDLIEVVGTTVDITERKRAEKERERLRQLESDLAHINRVSMMGELAASIAHEVNQPLSGIVSNGGACLRWLAADPPDIEEVREAVGDIVRDGKRAGEVIARIRALTKRAAIPAEKMDLNETIREVLAIVGDEAKRRNVTIRTRFAGDASAILGDRVQLQQVVLNLVMNAIEAMGSVSDRARELVISTLNIDPNQVQVTLQDSGTGLDPSKMARIFDPFYTTKPAGMGMGLSISRSIVQNHGGKLWATANDGPGTSFHFTLPKHHAGASDARATAV